MNTVGYDGGKYCTSFLLIGIKIFGLITADFPTHLPLLLLCAKSTLRPLVGRSQKMDFSLLILPQSAKRYRTYQNILVYSTFLRLKSSFARTSEKYENREALCSLLEMADTNSTRH